MKTDIDSREWDEMSVSDRHLYLRLCFENGENGRGALVKASRFSNFGLTLIHFIEGFDWSIITRERADVIVAAHAFFTRHLKTGLITDSEEVKIKPLLVKMLFTTHFRVLQEYVVDDILELADHFAVHWPTLLSELKEVHEETRKEHQYYSINGFLIAINALSVKFRNRRSTHNLLVNKFSESLEWLFRDTCAVIPPADEWLSLSPKIYGEIFESQKLCCKVLRSFMIIELPRYFKHTIDEWVPQLLTYLRADLFGVDFIDELRIAACELLFFCMETQGDLFKEYLHKLVDAVRNLLLVVVTSESSIHDQLAEINFKFLWKVKNNRVEDLYDRDNTNKVLQQMCEEIVLPYVMARDKDEELFNKDYDGFIHRDMHDSGPLSSLYSSRRIACDLLGVIETPLLSQSAKKVSRFIKAWFNEFAENVDVNWKHKEFAMYVVISLADKRKDGKAQSSHIIKDVQEFFSSLVVPELQSQYIDKFPMLKARALEFFIIFRFLIPKPTAVTLLPNVIRLLLSDSSVVRSYAAGCIEVLLRGTGNRGFTSADIGPVLLEMMHTLLKALEKTESDKNPYIMKCIVRVLRLAGISVEIADLCFKKLLPIFERACKSSTDFAFNWNLFEAIDVLLEKTLKTFSDIGSYDKTLFPTLKLLLDESGEFEFYAYNLFCQLVKLHNRSLPTCYEPIFRNLQFPKSYRRARYIQGVQVRLLKTFLEMPSPSFLRKGNFKWLSEVFVSLDIGIGFQMLTAVVNNIEFDVLAQYMNGIWTEIFNLFCILTKTQERKVSEYFVVLMSRFVIKFGPENLVESMDSVGVGVFLSVIQNYWIPSLKIIRSSLEQGLCLVASSRLICESRVFLDPLTDEIWGGMLDSILTLLLRTQEDKIISPQLPDRFKEDPEVENHIVETYHLIQHAEAYNGRKVDEDHSKDRIENAEQLLVDSLASFFTRFPQRCLRLIRENLCEKNQAAFIKFCDTYGYSFDDS